MARRIGTYVRDHHLALLCLFLILGGGTALAAGLAKNSVKSKHIKDGQVKSQDIGLDAVDAEKIAGLEALGADALPLEDETLNGLPITATLSIGDFDFRLLCNEDPAGTFTAEIELASPSSMSVDSDGDNSQNEPATVAGSGKTLILVGPTINPNVRNGSFGAIANNGNTSVTGEVVAGTEIQGADCAFAVSALGG